MLNLIKCILIIALLLLVTVIGCPTYELFGIVCPCCGVTRAWLAFLQGDVLLAFRYHALFPMIPVIGAVYVYGCWKAEPFSKMTTIIMCGMASAVFVYGALRWLGCVAMP